MFDMQIELEQMRREEVTPSEQQVVVVKKITSTKPKTAAVNENLEGKKAQPKNAPAPASVSSTTESAAKQSNAHYVC